MPPSTSTLLMKTHSQAESFSLKVRSLTPRGSYSNLPKSTVSFFLFFLKKLFLPAGRRVWAYSDNGLVRGYPKRIRKRFRLQGVRKIDAALHDEKYGKTLFFVGDSYYRCVWSICSFLISVSRLAVLYLIPSLNVSNVCVSAVMMRPAGLWTGDSPSGWIRPSPT